MVDRTFSCNQVAHARPGYVRVTQKPVRYRVQYLYSYPAAPQGVVVLSGIPGTSICRENKGSRGQGLCLSTAVVQLQTPAYYRQLQSSLFCRRMTSWPGLGFGLECASRMVRRRQPFYFRAKGLRHKKTLHAPASRTNGWGSMTTASERLKAVGMVVSKPNSLT